MHWNYPDFKEIYTVNTALYTLSMEPISIKKQNFLRLQTESHYSQACRKFQICHVVIIKGGAVVHYKHNMPGRLGNRVINHQNRIELCMLLQGVSENMPQTQQEFGGGHGFVLYYKMYMYLYHRLNYAPRDISRSPRNFATMQIYCLASYTLLFTGCLTKYLRGRKVASGPSFA
jgi:hypothetical protein